MCVMLLYSPALPRHLFSYFSLPFPGNREIYEDLYQTCEKHNEILLIYAVKSKHANVDGIQDQSF